MNVKNTEQHVNIVKMVTLVDLLCWSARKKEQIEKNLIEYAKAGQLIISRHKNAEKLNMPGNIIEIEGSENGWIRFRELIAMANSDLVCFVADDDIVCMETLEECKKIARNKKRLSTFAVQTTDFKVHDNGDIDFVEYLRSSSLRKEIERKSNTLKERIRNSFEPLSIDWYTIYRRESLMLIIEKLEEYCSAKTLDLVTGSGKSFQYIMAFAIQLAGEIAIADQPLYGRGAEASLRFQEEYQYIVQNKESKSLGEQLKELFDSKEACKEVIDSLSSIYANGFYSQLEEVEKLNIAKEFQVCMILGMKSVNLQLLDIMRSGVKLKIRMTKRKAAIQLGRLKKERVMILVEGDDWDELKCPWWLTEMQGGSYLESSRRPSLRNLVETIIRIYDLPVRPSEELSKG